MAPMVPTSLPVLRGEEGLRAVLDHRDAARVGDAHDAVDVARVAEEVGDDDRPRARRDARRDRLGRDVAG